VNRPDGGGKKRVADGKKNTVLYVSRGKEPLSASKKRKPRKEYHRKKALREREVHKEGKPKRLLK